MHMSRRRLGGRTIRPLFDNVDNTQQRNSSKLDMQVSTGDRSLTEIVCRLAAWLDRTSRLSSGFRLRLQTL